MAPGLWPNGEIPRFAVLGDDGLVREYHPAIDQRNRKLPCPCLLRPGHNTARGRATTGVDRRTICRDVGTLARPEGRSPRPSHVSDRLCCGLVSHVSTLADAQSWQLERSGASEHNQPAQGSPCKSGLDWSITGCAWGEATRGERVRARALTKHASDSASVTA